MSSKNESTDANISHAFYLIFLESKFFLIFHFHDDLLALVEDQVFQHSKIGFNSKTCLVCLMHTNGAVLLLRPSNIV